MILPRLSPDGLTPAQREARGRLHGRTDAAAERIRRAADVAAQNPTGAESTPEHPVSSVESDREHSAPVVLPAEAVEALADAFGVAAASIRDGILSASLPTIDGGRVVICSPGPRPCVHYVYAGVCIKCGDRDGGAA